MMDVLRCHICLAESGNLVPTWETDSNNVTWGNKLSFCVPEMGWCDQKLLCTNCISQLECAWTFRKLCLQSSHVSQVRWLKHDYEAVLETTKPMLNENLSAPSIKLTSHSNKLTFGCLDYVCYHCKDTYTSKNLLIEHIASNHEKKQCHLCRETLANLTALKNHFLEIHQDKNLEVKDKVKRGRKRLEDVSHTCQICGTNFNTSYLLKRHVRNVHATEKKFNCDMCEQKFASPVYLNAHKRYHSRERPHICSFCGKGFITGSDLYHHEKIHGNKREYKCEKCSKAFNTSSDLHKHKLCVHQDRSEWKYVCKYCDRRFPLKTNLDAHIKTHTGERNFACHLCDRKCVNRSVLRRHVKSHSNVRLFKCVMCNVEYKYQKSLDIHMAKAHGIGNVKIPERTKKYFCHVCPKSYFANNKLQKHIRTHTGERPFSCEVCEKRFIDKSYVKQHLKIAHNSIYVAHLS